jgi:hypothetical protein
MSDSYDDYEAKIQLAEYAWEQALETEQEPVAYLHNETELLRLARRANSGDFEPSHWRPLYTAPPKREWVGLTDEEVSEIIDQEIGFNSCWGPEEAFARAIEAKLREKNHG